MYGEFFVLRNVMFNYLIIEGDEYTLTIWKWELGRLGSRGRELWLREKMIGLSFLDPPGYNIAPKS